jgi:large subunit ribosomal protein L21
MQLQRGMIRRIRRPHVLTIMQDGSTFTGSTVKSEPTWELDMYAVFQTGGKQFRAEPGVRLRIPTLDVEPGDSVTFDHVLLAGDGAESIQVGVPIVDGASVKAEVLRHGRGDKIIVFKRKRRKGYRKKQGHRQNFTEIRINEVALS